MVEAHPRRAESQLIVDAQLTAQLLQVRVAREDRMIEAVDRRAIRQDQWPRQSSQRRRRFEDLDRQSPARQEVADADPHDSAANDSNGHRRSYSVSHAMLRKAESDR